MPSRSKGSSALRAPPVRRTSALGFHRDAHEAMDGRVGLLALLLPVLADLLLGFPAGWYPPSVIPEGSFDLTHARRLAEPLAALMCTLSGPMPIASTVLMTSILRSG